MKKRKHSLALIFGLSLMVFVLFGVIRTETAFATSPNSTKSFVISSNSVFTKKANINSLVVNINQVFPIYIYATNNGDTQSPEVVQDIPVTVTLIDPNNITQGTYNVIIPKGPSGAYATLNISGTSLGKWTVKVSGDPGKGFVTVTNYFAVTGSQASLNIIPAEATISLGSTQQFGAVFTNSSIPAFNYTLFSGSSTSTLTLNGSKQTINGSSHSNNYFTANGSNINITGTVEAVKTVTVNGNAIQIGKIVQNAPYIGMPDFSDTIKTQADAAGQTYNGDKTYNGSNISVDFPIYVNGNLTINGSHFSGKGTIVATGNITFTGSNLNNTSDDSVLFYSKNGNITINGSSSVLYGMLYAPNGTITMNGSAQTIYGRVIGNNITINGSGLDINSSDNDLNGLPSSGVTDVTNSVTWSSSNPNVATISSTGVATSTGLGTSTITASYTINNVTYTDTSQLTVVLPTLSIEPAISIISSGSTQQYQAILTDYDGKETDVTQTVIWSSSFNFLASAIINQFGLATGHGFGTVTITATHQSGASSTATLIIKMPTLSIIPLSKNILPGATLQYQALLNDYAGYQTDVTQSVSWSSDNSTVATVNGGLATGNIAGTITITATDQKSGASSTATLTVMAPDHLQVTLANAISLTIGGNVPATATLVYPDNSTKDVTNSVTWTTSNPYVATVDSTGKVTSVGGGECLISATDLSSWLSGTVNLSVLPALTISPSSSTIPIGFELHYNAQLVYADGTAPQDVTGSVTWTSSNPGVAGVESGLATANAVGTTVITAHDPISGSSNLANLKVTDNATVTALIVTPIPDVVDAIFVGYTQQFSAQLQFGDGSPPSDVTTSVSWSSSPQVATIDDTGLVSGIAPGTSIISALVDYNGKPLIGSYLLTVLPPQGGIIREWEQ